MEYYTEELATSSINNESGVTDSQYEEEEEEGGTEDFCRYRKEQIFTQIDFDKHKTKIACTIGYAILKIFYFSVLDPRQPRSPR